MPKAPASRLCSSTYAQWGAVGGNMRGNWLQLAPQLMPIGNS
jgi:hypothetical protein